ncbi:MAG: hypothetical protein F6J92_21600 [Symploca sp. SIO1A3]|nr:hypothetical protein [Symploca sp. SIO1A3]
MADSAYGPRDLMAVKPIAGVDWMYGFHTKTRDATRTTLGQVPGMVNGAYIAGLVIGANAPRPAEVRKPRSTDGRVHFDSSYCSADALQNARAEGWTIVKAATKRRGGARANSKTVYVDVQKNDDQGNPVGPSIRYAWYMRNELYTAIQVDLPKLGVTLSTGNEEDLVFGASYPRPPSVKFTAIPAAGYITTKSSFIDPKKLDAIPDGWTLKNGGNY